MDSPLYAKFDISETAYKVVNNQEIKAYVLTPKNISSGKHPVVVKFHGGFFVSFSALEDGRYFQEHLSPSSRSLVLACFLTGIHHGHWTTACFIQPSL
jgi:acetyl esterase/lipase